MIITDNPKKKSKKGGRKIIFFLFFLMFLIPAILAISYWAHHTSLFAVTSIRIKGNQAVSEQEILSKLGNIDQINLFSLETEILEGQIETIPRILNADIDKRLPNKIIITTEEREAIALINSQNNLYCIDNQGKIWEKNDEKLRMPFISKVPANSISSGDTLKVENLENMIQLVELTENENLISEIYTNQDKEIVIYTMDEGVKVNFGVNNFEKKIVYLKKILSQLKNKEENINSIDLRFERQAVVKLSKK